MFIVHIYRLMIRRVWKPKTAGEQQGERVRLDPPPPRIRTCTGCSHNVDLYCSDRVITTVVYRAYCFMFIHDIFNQLIRFLYYSVI